MIPPLCEECGEKMIVEEREDGQYLRCVNSDCPRGRDTAASFFSD